jgi:hypothetical protein
MYELWRTYTYAATAYFFLLWLIGERFIVNLILGIVTVNFSKAKNQVDESKTKVALEFETYDLSLFKKKQFYKPRRFN